MQSLRHVVLGVIKKQKDFNYRVIVDNSDYFIIMFCLQYDDLESSLRDSGVLAQTQKTEHLEVR